jgi:hypothetical protein
MRGLEMFPLATCIKIVSFCTSWNKVTTLRETREELLQGRPTRLIRLARPTIIGGWLWGIHGWQEERVGG